MREPSAALPVLAEHVAEAEVGDARAADPTECAEWSRVRREIEQPIDPVATALERSAVMWRAERDQRAQTIAPVPADMTGTARDEAAHAVAEQHELVDGDGPRCD